MSENQNPEFESARGDVPPDQPEVAASGVPVVERDRSHQGEPIPCMGAARRNRATST